MGSRRSELGNVLVDAAAAGGLVTVRREIENGANVEARSKDGDTALMWACYNNHLEVVRYVIEHGAKINAMNRSRNTALVWAAWNGNLEVVRYLVENGADVDMRCDGDWTALMRCVLHGHLETVRYLVDHNADIQLKDNRGMTALMIAISGDHVDVARFLVQRGADVRVKDNLGRTTLMVVKKSGHLEMVKYLVEQGVNVELKDKDGCTALMKFGRDGNFALVRHLVERGAVVDAKNNVGDTALMLAGYSGFPEIVKLLVECGADIDTKNNHGWSALTWAVDQNHLDVVRYLVEQGVDKETKDKEGCAALTRAAVKGHLEVVRYLVDQGADKEAKNNVGDTALILAVDRGYLEIVSYLVDRGADTGTKNEYGWTALMRAVWNDRMEVVDYLMAHASKNEAIVEMLHQSSFDLNAANSRQIRILAFMNVSSGQYLDGRNPGMQDPFLSSGERNPATDLCLQWIIGDAGKGRIYIKSASSGQYLDGRNPGVRDPILSSGDQNPTINVHLQWVIGDAGNGCNFIKSVSSGQYLDGRKSGVRDPILSSEEEIPASDVCLQWNIVDITADSTAGFVQQSNFQGLNKITRVAPVPECQKPTLAFKSVSSGQYLDGRNPGMQDPFLSSGERNPATDLCLQWIIGDAGKGRIYIKSASSGQYLDGRNPGVRDPILSSGDQNPTINVHLQWVIGDAGNGCNFIKSVSSGQYLDGRKSGVRDPILSSEEEIPASDVCLQWNIVDITADSTAGFVQQSNFQGLNKITRVAPVPECQKPTLAFKSVSSGQYLDGRNPGMQDPFLSSGERNPATDLCLQWIIGDAGKGRIYIKSASSGQYLDGRNPGVRDPILSSGDQNPTINVHLQWVIGDAGNGCNFIKSVSSGQYLDGRKSGVRDPILSSEEEIPASDVCLQWDIQSLDSDSLIALNWAARRGHLDFMQFLIQQGASLDVCDSDGRTVLMWAASGGYLDIVCFLVKARGAVDAHDTYGQTPLMWATRNGHLEVVRYLVEHGATVDARDRDGRTPLVRAAGNGHLDMVHCLVDLGATVDAHDSNGITALMQATRDYPMEMMYDACNGHLDVVRFLVEHGAAVDACSSEGMTSLMFAAIRGHPGIVHFLMEQGAAVDACNSHGVDSLMFSALYGHSDVVRVLIDHGAAIDSCYNNGVTPLMISSHGGHLDVVRFLVEHGADMEAGNNDGVTPLMLSARRGHLDVVRCFIEHGADMEAGNNDGVTPLMYSVRGGHLDVVRFFVEQNVGMDICDDDGWTPLMYTARDGNLDILRFFVDNGADVNGSSNDEWTPLMLAACDGHYDLVVILVEKGADVNVRSTSGWTPLMWASKHGHLEVVHFLVKHDADVNLISETGDTTLSCAAQFGHQEIVQFLVPRVRYQHQNTQTESLEENMKRHSNMPFNWLIAPFEIEVEPFDDAGRFGGDYRGKWLDADVVIKLFVDAATSATFVDEVRLWHQLRHPNVLKLYGVCNSYHHFFVCEYASKGSLPMYLKSCNAKRRTPWKFLHEAALGLEYLHERKIVHGNLRGSNILIGSDGLAKLSGFGLSASSPKGIWSISSAWVRWASPEALRNNRVTFASDVYSMGMCIVEAVSGNIPFNGRNGRDTRYAVKYERTGMSNLKNQMAMLTEEQRELVREMCCDEPRERLQVPVIVSKLKRFVEVEAANLTQHTADPESEPLMKFDAFDELKSGKTSEYMTKVQRLIAKSENTLYRKMCLELEMIYDSLKLESHLWSTFERFHGLLDECRLALDTMSKQNRICRLSATRAREHSVQGLHRRISQLLHLVHPPDDDAETLETEWKRLCREQVEMFVSEVSEACVLLNSVDSEEDRSALVAVLRAELRNIDGKYTDKQLEVLQKTCDDIVSKSLEDVHLATTPEWFIPWFELEMNKMVTLGEGGFGDVFKARWLDSEVVVKKLDKDAANDAKRHEMRQMFEREVDIWFGLSHPHVVRLFGACHVGRPFFVCELAPNGTLVEYLRHHPDELWSKLREAALGVQYLHARGIVHGDLKGNNILIGSDGKAKVTDFGLSGVFGDDSAEMMLTGAWHWVAPECLLGEKPTFASDVYSLGMCIVEALRVSNGATFYLPWGDLLNPAVKYQVTRLHKIPCQPQNCLDEEWTLIERMCKSDPAHRMLIMTVVDELQKLADRHGELSGDPDQKVINNGKLQLMSPNVTETLTEMKNWFIQRDAKQDWEMNILGQIYQLLWDRLEEVATQMFNDGGVKNVGKTITRDFSTLVERLQLRTRTALDITDVIPLAKFTELALGAYGSHRRLDKFMAAHIVSNDTNHIHNWTSACSTLMGVSASLTPACIEEGHSVVKVAASFIEFVCRDYAKPIQNMTYESSLSIDRVRGVQEEINAYFIEQAKPTDLRCQQEIIDALDSWLEKIKKQVTIATESALKNLPRTFSGSNTTQLSSVFEAIHKGVKQSLQASTEEFKSSITALLEKRQRLAVASFEEIQQLLTKFGIQLPAEMKPKFSTVADNTASKHDFIYKLNAWLAKMVELIQQNLAQEIKQVDRVKVEPGSFYDAEHDFAGGTASDNAKIHGRFIRGDDHVKLGHHMNLQMSCQVGSAYAGQSFLLELSHLTSHIGEGSRAPVTVRVNGHTIRENLCPRVLHERNGNKVGVYKFVTDRWHVSSAFIHEGENIVSITYCDHGTSYYWVSSIGLRCALPWTSTTEVHTQDVIKIFDAAMTASMQLGLEQKVLLDRVLQETSPMLALAVLHKTYDDIVSKAFEEIMTTPEWFIPWFELEMNEMEFLGVGGFGNVYKTRWLDSEVVVKKLEIDPKDASNIDKKREMRKMFEREVDIWFGLSHPHVVRLFGACHVGRPFFVCELAPNGTLDEYLRRHADELWSKLLEAALGVQYLHARGIVHGDLKGNNILIGSDGKAKVTDFGLSGVFGDDSSEMVVSEALHWVAPECILGQKPTFASDIYSLGMCMIEALRVTNGDKYYLPWGDQPNMSIKHHATRNTLPLQPKNCSDKVWALIERMCKNTPADRMLIMTVVDELEKLADRHEDLSGETDQIVSDVDKLQLVSSVTDAPAEMKNWITDCDTNQDWEKNALSRIYLLLWDRLEQVATQLLSGSDDTVVAKTTISDFTVVVECSQIRTRAALGITGNISLVKFTELALGGYALHRRLDKFMAAHVVSKDSNPFTTGRRRAALSWKFSKAEAETETRSENPVLFKAAEEGYLDDVRDLVEHGVDILVRNDDGETALIKAVFNDHLEVVKYLVGHDAPLNEKNGDGDTALVIAAGMGYQRIVKYLVENGADVNAKNNNGDTALIKAASQGYQQIVEYLVDHSLKTDREFDISRMGLIEAATRGYLSVVQYLVEHGADVNGTNRNLETALMKSTEEVHLDVGQYLVEKSADIEATDENGYTALRKTVDRGHLDVVQYLVKNHAAIEATDKVGDTALISAARVGHLDVMIYLIENGANIEAKNNDGWTALMWAADQGHIDVVQYLFKRSANKEAKDNCGRTALIQAACNGRLDIVRNLIAQGADKEAKDNNGRTALIWVVKDRHLNVVQYLVKVDANKEAEDNIGRTALTKAALYDHVNVVRYLIEQGSNKDTALEWAAKNLRLNVIRHVVEQNKDRDTALLWAARCGHLLVVRYLVELDADISYLDEQGNSALVHVLNLNIGEDEMLQIAGLLLEHGAPPLESNKHGESAKSIAKAKGYHLIAALVEEYADKSRQNSERKDQGGEDQGREDKGGEDKGKDQGGEDKGGEDQGGEDKDANDQGGEDKGGENQGGEDKGKDQGGEDKGKDQGGEDKGGEDQGGENKGANDQGGEDKGEDQGGEDKGEDQGGEDKGEDQGGEDKGGEDNGKEDPKWFISFDAVKKMKGVLGKGSSGKVYRAKWSNIDVVLKEVSMGDKERFMEEVDTWYDLRHDYIVPLYGANHQQQPPFIVSKYASRGELVPYLKGEGKTFVWRKLREVAAGISYLHGCEIVHGDLRGDNIVVSAYGTAMVTDFGLSFSESGSCRLVKMINSLGAMQWRAPEFTCITEEQPTHKSDIFSLGMCIIESVKGAIPWGASFSDDEIRQIFRDGKFKIDQPDELKEAQWNLVKAMIALSPRDRPDMGKVMSMLEGFAEDEECPPILSPQSF